MDTRLLIGALIVVVACVAIARLRRKPPVAAPLTTTNPEPIEIHCEPDTPVGFGRKNAWIAAPARSSAELADSLGLTDVEPANWQSGFVAAYAYHGHWVFVTPPIDGWVMAVGGGLPDPSDPDALGRWRSLMSTVSSRLGEAQYYATHRVSGYSAWSRYRNGVEERLFAYADDPIHDLGDPLSAEAAIRRRLPDLKAAENDPDYWQHAEVRTPDEDDVFHMAGALALDPSALEERELEPSVGLLCKMRRSSDQSND